METFMRPQSLNALKYLNLKTQLLTIPLLLLIPWANLARASNGIELIGGRFLKAALLPGYLEGFLESISQNNITEDYTYNSSSGEQPSFSKSLNNVSSECGEDVLKWLQEIGGNWEDFSSAQSWALQMLDSWGKPPEGVLSGHVNSLGDFDECLAIRGPANPVQPFRGKYCTNYFLLPQVLSNSSAILPNQIERRSPIEMFLLLETMFKTDTKVFPSVASCLPSTCSQADVQLVITLVLAASPLFKPFEYVVATEQCFTDETRPLNFWTIFMIIFLVVLGVFCIVGTTLDLLSRYEYIVTADKYYFGWLGSGSSTNSKWETLIDILLAFSLLKNALKLLNSEVASSSSKSTDLSTNINMNCLCGIKFLSAAWVVLGHTFYMHMLQPMWNLTDLAAVVSDDFSSLFVANGAVVVDTFFTMTGVLVTVNVLQTLERSGGKLNVPMMYLFRYIRLTPMYAILIGISATILPYLGSGPSWNVVDKWAEFCQVNWWKNLLYINNLPLYDLDLASPNKLCYGESWYLGVDMQLFLLSPAIIYPLWRWNFGKLILAFLTLGSILIPVFVTYLKELLPAPLIFREAGMFTYDSYMVPWMRASPYLIGIWTGYFLHLTKPRSSKRIPKKLTFLLWAISTGSALAVLLGPHNFFDWRPRKLSRVGGAIYAGMDHAVWGLCIGWTIFACCRGYGGVVNGFLSWRPFIPLSRLTYGIYLLSFHLQFILHFGYRTPIYFTNYGAVNQAFSHLVMSCLMAFIFSITMEAPFLQLEKLLLRKGKRASRLESEARKSPPPNPVRLGQLETRNYGSRESTEIFIGGSSC